MGIFDFFKKNKSIEAKKPTKKMKIRKYKMEPIELKNWKKNTTSISLNTIIPDEATVKKAYADLMHRVIPSVSGAIWTWTKLCNTKFFIKFVGGTNEERKRARKIIEILEKKLNPMKSVKNGGINNLFSVYFMHLFRYGRFSGSLIFNEDVSNVKGFYVYNPYNIKFQEKTLNPYILSNSNELYELNEQTFYYYAQNMDNTNPYGIGMLESTPILQKIADDLLRDMANSSSNAGVPRLHVKINQPEQFDKENNEDYVGRSNTYFDETCDNLADIGSDENFYTWGDVDIGVAGGAQGASGFVWRANRQIIDEELITAYHLYPWVLAKSFGTTKNWVQTQFDLLMIEVESIQNEAINFINWIMNIELNLNGIYNVKAVGHFDRIRDPEVKNMAVAERFQIDNVLTKIKNGIISPDDGARLLGEEKAYNPKLTISEPVNVKKPKTRVDESENPVDGEDNPEKSPDKKARK